MTIGQKTLMIDHLITVNRTFDEKLPFREKKEMLKLVRKGLKEVLDNPEKYGLMLTPTIQEIQDWFTEGQEINEGYWQKEQGFTVGDVFATVLNAFEHFKNKNHESKSK